MFWRNVQARLDNMDVRTDTVCSSETLELSVTQHVHDTFVRHNRQCSTAYYLSSSKSDENNTLLEIVCVTM